MRAIWAGAVSALMVVGLATSAWAQNGLQRFEKELKPQLEFKSLTYKNATAVGTSGFVLTDVVAVVPANPATGDKESTVKVDKIAVDELDFDRLKKDAKDDEAPRFARLKIEGNRAELDGTMLVGKGPLALGGWLSWARMPVSGSLTIQGKDLEAQYPGMARIYHYPLEQTARNAGRLLF
mgnify:CR=1 FL=1